MYYNTKSLLAIANEQVITSKVEKNNVHINFL